MLTDSLLPLWSVPHVEERPLILHPYAPFFHKTVGALFLAGGHGSRLETALPKAMVPIPPSGKTLLEIFLRRMVGFFRLYSRWPHCLLMTSEENEESIQQYLHMNDYFGVPRKYVHSFCQSSLPLLDEMGNPLLENGILQKGPDGNGRVCASLSESGLLQRLKDEGLDALSLLNIDNPLMDPFLPSLFHPVLEEHEEASILAIVRKSAQERTGLFYLQKGKLHVIEYSEAPSSVKNALSSDGTLLYRWANISVLCMTLSTIEKLASLSLPIHLAKKMRNSKPIYKQEYFIFDIFPALSSFSLIGLDRNKWFSPIKSKEGEDSLEQAAQALNKMQEEQALSAPLFSFEGKRGADIDPALLYGLVTK